MSIYMCVCSGACLYCVCTCHVHTPHAYMLTQHTHLQIHERLHECMYVRMLGCMSAPLYVHVTHTQHTHTHRLVICSWPLPFLVLCLVFSCTFVYVRMYVPVCNLWSGLFPFSELVCDLLPRRLFDGFRQRCIARKVSQSQFWRVMLGRTLGSFDAFPTLVGEHHWSLGTTFLGS